MAKQVHASFVDDDEIEPGGPPIGDPVGDGIPGFTDGPPPVRLGPSGPSAPRLCVVGPCANYHRFVVQTDSQGSIDGSRSPIHEETRHYCYPSPGLELEMNNQKAVFECNKWRPIPPEALIGRDADRTRAMKSLDGEVFQRQLVAFHAYRDEVFAEAEAEVARQQAEAEAAEKDTAIADEIAPQHAAPGSIL